MKLPRKITATAISALALALGITTIQAPSAAAADRTLQPPQPNVQETFPGEQVVFTYFPPKGVGRVESPATHRGNGKGNATIVLRDTASGAADVVLSGDNVLSNLQRFVYVLTPPVPGAEICAKAFYPSERVRAGELDTIQQYADVPAIRAETCVPIRAKSTIFPRAPYLTPTGGGNEIFPTASVAITAHLGGGIFTQEQVLSRGVTTSFMNTNNPLSCSSGNDTETVNATSAGSQPFTYQRTIPGGTVGLNFCMQQFVKTDLMDSITYSEPVTFRITSNPNVGAGIPNVNLGSALARLQEATQRLQQVQGRPNVDQAALAAAAAEAEEARRQAAAAAAQAQAQAAAAAAQGQAPPAGAPSAAQIAQAQQAAEAANAQVEQAIGQSTAGTGKQTALSALAIATGFDPFTTPVLQGREKNASGVSIEVTAPDTIRQKKRLRTKLEVLDPATRGGMRQYLLDLNGATPRLLLKRSGFVPDGVENKRYWISKNFQPGTYGLLTTFLPSTPGMQGIAVYDTIEVTEAPKKKKKKGKKNRN